MEGPNKEFADPERIELMEQFAQEYYEIYRYKEIPQSTYAFLWLSDIERLRELVENPRLTNNQDERETILRWLQKGGPGSKQSSKASSVVSRLKPAASSVPSSPIPAVEAMPPPSTPSKKRELSSTSPSSAEAPTKKTKVGGVDDEGRSKTASRLAGERDKGCILERCEVFDVAHIYPHSLRNQEHAAIFIKTLRTYWNEERVNAWLSAAYGIGVAGPHNLICLSPNAHRLHGAAYFAFDFGSYSQDGEKKSLELRFHWLKRAALRIQIPAAEIPSLELEMPTSVALFDIQKNCGDRDHRFRSGKMVRVETDDPIQKPLPLQPLIEMQWLLNGVAALSAAAEPEVLQGDESSDDDDDWRLRLCSSDFVPGSTPRNSSQDTSLPSSSAGHKVRTGKDEKPDFE